VVGVLAKFTEERPNNPSGWYSYGRCLFRTGECQGAAESILKAYRLSPTDCEIYQALCEILPAAGRLEEVRLLAEEMRSRFPDRWSVWATAGRVLVECFQEIERGCSLSAKGTQLQPLLADAWFRHGRVLALAGKHREAVEALAHGSQLIPSAGGYPPSVSAAVWLGESYRVLGDEAASRRCWEEACQQALELMAVEPAMAHYWQGRALSGLGEGLGAMEAYRSALSQQLLYPTRGEVEGALKRLQARGRKGSRA
jgi:tetratricopeptide (TPR) repeat protein